MSAPDNEVLKRLVLEISLALDLEAVGVVAVNRDGSSLILIALNDSDFRTAAFHELAHRLREMADHASHVAETGEPLPPIELTLKAPDSTN